MAKVKPFRGYRPRTELAKKVASKPYDVLSTEEAREEVIGNSYSFLHVVKSEIDLDASVDPYSDAVYQRAKANLNQMMRSKVLVQDSRDCFYFYRQVMERRSQVGIVSLSCVDEYFSGQIKKHEFTRPKKVEDRIKHIEACNANTGPVFLTYRSKENAELQQLANQWTESRPPDCDFVDEQDVRHSLWVVFEPKVVEQVQKGFDQVSALYIADGHHRTEAAATVCKKRQEVDDSDGNHYFLSVIFPSDELKILDYNRVVRDLNGLTPDEFLSKLNDKFEVQRRGGSNPYRPTKKMEFGMYLDGQWYSLSAKAEHVNQNHPIESLDVYYLQKFLLQEILSIDDPRTDDRIDFVGGIRGLNEIERRCKTGMAVGFSMFPTSIDELLNVADSGEVMPPKSTWFEPKLKSGLVVREL